MSNFQKFMKFETSTALETFSKNMTSYVNRDSVSVKCDCYTHNNSQGCQISHSNNLQIVRPTRFGFRLKMNDQKNGFVIYNPELYHKSGQRLGAGYWRNTTCDCDIHDDATNEKVANMHFCLDDKGAVHNLQLQHEHDNDLHSHEYIDSPHDVCYNVTDISGLIQASLDSSKNSNTIVNVIGEITNDVSLNFKNTVVIIQKNFINNGDISFVTDNNISTAITSNIDIRGDISTSTSFINNGTIKTSNIPSNQRINIAYNGNFINSGTIELSDISSSYGLRVLANGSLTNDASGAIHIKNIIAGYGVYVSEVSTFNNLGKLTYNGVIQGVCSLVYNGGSSAGIFDESTLRNEGLIEFNNNENEQDYPGIGIVIAGHFTNENNITFNNNIYNAGFDLLNRALLINNKNITFNGEIGSDANVTICYGIRLEGAGANQPGIVVNGVDGEISFNNIAQNGVGINNVLLENSGNIYFGTSTNSYINGYGLLNLDISSTNYNNITFDSQIFNSNYTKPGSFYPAGISGEFPIINIGTIKFNGYIINQGVGYSISTDVSSNYYNSNSGNIIFDCSLDSWITQRGVGLNLSYNAFNGKNSELYKICDPSENVFNIDSSCNFINGAGGNMQGDHITFPGCSVQEGQPTLCGGYPFRYPDSPW